jgi:hypothetical protein
MRPFRVFHTEEARGSFSEDVRAGTDAMEFSSALIGRDTQEDSPTYGQTANAALVAYWVNPETHSLNRYESYDLSVLEKGTGWEFAHNLLAFEIECFDRWSDPQTFRAMDWSALDRVTQQTRRGLPMAVKVHIRVTDERHMMMYEYDTGQRTMVLKPDFSHEDDLIAQSFIQVIHVTPRQ